MSLNPETGAPYRMAFPTISVRDMVRVQASLCDHFGIERLHAVVGGSLGGMQALQWGVTFPERTHAVIAIGASGRFHAQGIAYNEVGRRAIMADPKWCGGDYPYDDPPRDGFAIARMVGMITYQCDEGMQARFGRNPATRPSRHPAFGGKFDVEGYLHYQGDSIGRRFDPNAHLYLSRAMDLFDLGNGFASYTEALRRLTMPLLLIGISSDILFPPGHVRGVAEEVRALGGNAHYWELVSPDGHDAFLKEFDAMTPILRRFLQSGAEGG
jgi:homoserine O-acetyltransferase